MLDFVRVVADVLLYCAICYLHYHANRTIVLNIALKFLICDLLQQSCHIGGHMFTAIFDAALKRMMWRILSFCVCFLLFFLNQFPNYHSGTLFIKVICIPPHIFMSSTYPVSPMMNKKSDIIDPKFNPNNYRSVLRTKTSLFNPQRLRRSVQAKMGQPWEQVSGKVTTARTSFREWKS